MPVFSVNVKWGKEKYKVELNTEEPPVVFKAQLFALSGVEPGRQKVMMKGKTVNDEGGWSGFKLKDNATLMMMGTVGELPQAPAEPVRFLEDMTEDELTAVSKLPPGLPNLGNTCYLNSTLQCLHAIPELNTTLNRLIAGATPPTRSIALVKATATLFQTLDNAQTETQVQRQAALVWMTLQQQNPQFSEMEQGHPMQQDASECWGEFMRSLQESVPPIGVDGALYPGLPVAGRSFVDQFMAFSMKTVMKCPDAPAEPETVKVERLLQLRCHIEKEVNFVMSGIQHALSGMIIKRSETLGRDAEYSQKSVLTRLPSYAVVNFVRFYYKQKEQTNCKIRKDVKFNTLLDLNPICAPELQEKLKPAREKFKRYNDYTAEQAIKLKKEGKGKGKADDSAMDVAEAVDCEPHSFPDDIGSNNSGFYDLVAVLTHRGRSSKSGHYVGWVKLSSGKWVLFDDDNVTETTEEDVLKLSGGGGADWHMAYILVYASKKVPKVPADFVSLSEQIAESKEEKEGAAAAAAGTGAAAAAEAAPAMDTQSDAK